METRASTQAVAGHGGPAGTVHVVDPHPLNWLYITWNTMEEPVRTDEKGNIATRLLRLPRRTLVGHRTGWNLTRTTQRRPGVYSPRLDGLRHAP